MSKKNCIHLVDFAKSFMNTFYFDNITGDRILSSGYLDQELRSSSAAEERVAVNVSAAAFCVKKHKLRLNNDAPNSAAVRRHRGRPRTMLNLPPRLVTLGCFDD